MKRGILILSVLVVLMLVFFVPINREESVLIKAPFLKVYKELLIPRNWVKWDTVLKNDFTADSAKVDWISTKNGFIINSPSGALNVKETASIFSVKQQSLNGDNSYVFTTLPDKKGFKTIVNVTLRTNLIGYVAGAFSKNPFEATGINQFKNYMENDSLYYGYHIYKVLVPQADLLVIRKQVPKALQFSEAANSFSDLTKFIGANHLEKMQPVIAQFIPKGLDSTQVNVGFFINKEIKSTGYVTYVHMPKGGPLVVIDYKGSFNDRGKAYAALHSYFIDHTYQSAILPFETYFNDKLPTSETGKVNLRINFTSFQ